MSVLWPFGGWSQPYGHPSQVSGPLTKPNNLIVDEASSLTILTMQHSSTW